MSPRGPFGALLLAGACLLACGRSDLVDSVDPGGSAGATGAAGAAGTGGSGGAPGDLNALCTRACTKIVTCTSGVINQPTCVTQCLTGGMQTCPNFAEIYALTDKCLTRTDCVDFETCLQSVPACQGSGGAGSSGAAGVPGTTASEACFAACSRAVDCCLALSPTSPCGVLGMACGSGDPKQTAMACQSILTAGASVPGAASVCR